MDTKFELGPVTCQYCGMIHKTICPRIKRVEYSDMSPGIFKVVEFFAPNDYPKHDFKIQET